MVYKDVEEEEKGSKKVQQFHFMFLAWGIRPDFEEMEEVFGSCIDDIDCHNIENI